MIRQTIGRSIGGIAISAGIPRKSTRDQEASLAFWQKLTRTLQVSFGAEGEEFEDELEGEGDRIQPLTKTLR